MSVVIPKADMQAAMSVIGGKADIKSFEKLADMKNSV